MPENGFVSCVNQSQRRMSVDKVIAREKSGDKNCCAIFIARHKSADFYRSSDCCYSFVAVSEFTVWVFVWDYT